MSPEKRNRRKRDRYAGVLAAGFAVVTFTGGAVILGAEIVYRISHAFGFHEGQHQGEMDDGIWGLGFAIGWSTVLFLLSALHAAGTDAKLGRELVRRVIARVLPGKEVAKNDKG